MLRSFYTAKEIGYPDYVPSISTPVNLNLEIPDENSAYARFERAQRRFKQ